MLLFNIVIHILGEVHMNLEKYYRKAYKRNIAIKLFEKKKGAAARREKMAGKLPPPVVEETTADIPKPETKADLAAAAAEAAAAKDGDKGNYF